MKPRKRLEGALADWHPHPRDSNNSLVPVVRDAGAADEIADRFFDSAPEGYTPEPPPAFEMGERRRAAESAAVRERRRYLMRYVAGAVGLAAAIGLGALVRLTTTSDASAAERMRRTSSLIDSHAASEPVPSPAAASAMPNAPAPPASDLPDNAAAASQTLPPPADSSIAVAAPEPDPHATSDASHAKRASQRALERGHLKEAIEAGERAVAFDPSDADTWLILGGAYESRGSYAEARRCFTSCVHLAKRGARSECRALLR